METKSKMLSPKLDVVFHMIFGEQEHERITKKLIEDVIGEKVETIELEQTPYLMGEQVEDKVGIVDIRAKINKKEPVDIEMQIADNKDIEKRILYYWSKIYSNELKKGSKYEELKRAIVIIFLDYEIEKLKGLPAHTKWQIINTENRKIVLTEDLEIHIIEITNMTISEDIKKWILFLEDPGGEEMRKMAEKEPIIKEAIETLEEISSDEAKIRIAELREKYIRDRAAELDTAEEKGIKKGIKQGTKRGMEQGMKKGIKEGIKNEKIEMAKKLKAIGITTEEIKEVTGLTREEIENLGDISKEEAKMRMAELRQKYIMDRAAELDTAEEKGIKKGIKQGMEKGIKQGMEKGMKKGMEQGIKQVSIEIAKRMKLKNIPINAIAEITGLTKEEIEEI